MKTAQKTPKQIKGTVGDRSLYQKVKKQIRLINLMECMAQSQVNGLYVSLQKFNNKQDQTTLIKLHEKIIVFILSWIVAYLRLQSGVV